MSFRGEVMLKEVEEGVSCHLFMLALLPFGFITNVSDDNKDSFAYHNPSSLDLLIRCTWKHGCVLWKTGSGGERERGGEAKNSAHFESCLKFAARVQIAVKHVHDIEWLICIKKKKGGGMKGWKEVREGRPRELLGAGKAKSLWISCHYTHRREGSFIFNLWTWCPLNLFTFCNVTTTNLNLLYWGFIWNGVQL